MSLPPYRSLLPMVLLTFMGLAIWTVSQQSKWQTQPCEPCLSIPTGIHEPYQSQQHDAGPHPESPPGPGARIIVPHHRLGPDCAPEAQLLLLKAKEIDLQPVLGAHTPTSNAIFAMATNYDARTYRVFLRAARLVFNGDIVLGISKEPKPGVQELLTKYSTIAYVAEEVKLGDLQVGAALLRYELYKFWASKYSAGSFILVTDFRDAVLQSDPFVYHPREWQKYDIVVFQEFHPNKVINRCPFNSGWISSCYGQDALDEVGDGIVLCSGTTLGSRNGILVYANLIVEEHHRTKCQQGGIDQGFHNYLYYSGTLSEHLKVKSYSQGEGPINTVGAMHPTNRHNLKGSLKSYWKIVDERGYILNWNGERSPVVHQHDRFGAEVANLDRLGEEEV